MDKRRKRYSDEIEQKIIENYLSGMGQVKAGSEFNVTGYIVKKILRENNIPIRNFSEAASLSNTLRAYNKNEQYFKIESHNMAYILGFIAADGSISDKRNAITITLARVDREILEKIKNEMQIENPIIDRTTNNGFDISTLVWTSKEQREDLAKYSIVPRKTFTLIPPYDLSRKYWLDYIRGYFDGDGSISLLKNSNGRGQGNIRWQIGAATPNILQWIIDFFYEDYSIPKVSVLTQTKNRKSPYYYFQYSSISSRKIYSILYTENSLFLKRKKDKFSKIVSLFE